MGDPPEIILHVLGILIEEGWDVEEARYRKAMQHWDCGFVNAEDISPHLAGFYDRFATTGGQAVNP